MSWSIGEHNGCFIGYGVPAWCDHPGCKTEIDRGLSYVCGDEPYGGDHGCGLFFCAAHLKNVPRTGGRMVTGRWAPQLCERCACDREPFDPSPEHPQWINHLLTHESWQQWRNDNPEKVQCLMSAT